jgi:hypothetical protein
VEKGTMNNNNPPEAFVYMKVGNHAGERFDDILKRKAKERVQAGRIFWGYGGTACHPLMQVQPFARLYTKRQGNIYLFMEPVTSRANPELDPASEYSWDGANWHALPPGISVTGSRYAFILDQIEPSELEIDMDKYVVAIGRSRGKIAAEYLQGRIDKGCLMLPDVPPISSVEPLKKSIKLTAKLLEPYAVLLR